MNLEVFENKILKNSIKKLEIAIITPIFIIVISLTIMKLTKTIIPPIKEENIEYDGLFASNSCESNINLRPIKKDEIRIKEFSNGVEKKLFAIIKLNKSCP